MIEAGVGIAAAHKTLTVHLAELGARKAWSEAQTRWNATAGWRTLAAAATATLGVTWAKPGLRRWLPTAFDLIRAGTESEDPEPLIASLADALDSPRVWWPGWRRRREARHNAPERRETAERLLLVIVPGILEWLPQAQAMELHDVREEVRHDRTATQVAAVADDVSRLVTHSRLDEVFEGRLKSLPPSVCEQLGEMTAADARLAKQIAAELTEPTITPAEIVQRLVDHPPTWAQDSGADVRRVIADFAAAHDADVSADLLEAAATGTIADRDDLLLRAAVAALRHDAARARALLASVDNPALPGARILQAALDEDLVSVDADLATWASDPALSIVTQGLVSRSLIVRSRDDEALDHLERLAGHWPDRPVWRVELADALVRRASRPPQTTRVRDLERARSLALQARNDIRRYRGPSGHAAWVAMKASFLQERRDLVLAIGLPPPDGEALDDEARSPDVLDLVAEIGFVTKNETLVTRATELLGETPKGRLIRLRGRRRGGGGDQSAAGLSAEIAEIYDATVDPNDKFEVQHVAAAEGLDIPDIERVATANAGAATYLLALQEDARGDREAAIRRLRAVASPEPVQVTLLANLCLVDGRVDEAVELLLRAADELRNPSMRAQAAFELVNAGRVDQAAEVAEAALVQLPEPSEPRRHLLRLLISIAWNKGDYAGAERHAHTYLADTPGDPNVGWVLVGALYNRQATDAAHTVLVERSLTPRSADEAGAWLSLMGAHSPSWSWLDDAIRVFDEFGDTPDVAAAFVHVATTPHEGRDPADPEAMRSVAERLEAIAKRDSEHPVLELIPSDPLEVFLARAAEVVSHGAAEREAAVKHAVDNGLPVGVLAIIANRSYTELLVRGGPGFLAVRALQPSREDAVGALASIGSGVIVDLSSLATMTHLRSTWSHIRGAFSSITVAVPQRIDAVRARDSLARRAVGTIGWDVARGQLTYTELDPAVEAEFAERARFVLDEMVHLPGRQPAQPVPPGLLSVHEPWVSPMQLAVELGLPLLCDDLGLRRFAQAQGVVAFSTLDVVDELVRRGHLSAGDRDADLLELRSQGYVDLPLDAAAIRALGARDGWGPGRAAYQLMRPIQWALNLTATANALQAALNEVIVYNRVALPAWAGSAAYGFARASQIGNYGAAAGHILALTLHAVPVSPAEVPGLIAATRSAVAELGTPDVLERCAADLRSLLLTAHDAARTAQIMFNLVSSCELGDRLPFIRAAFDVTPG